MNKNNTDLDLGTKRILCLTIVLHILVTILTLFNIAGDNAGANSVVGNNVGGSLASSISYLLVSILTTLSYLTNLNKPILSISALVAAQVITLLQVTITEKSIRAGFISVGALFILSIVILLQNIHKVAEENKESKESDGIKGENKQNKLIATLFSNKPAYILKPYMHIIIWSIFIIAVTTIMQTDTIQSYGFNNQFKAYAALTIAIPDMLFISILTTSSLTVISLMLNTLLEAYTAYELSNLGEINVVTVISIAISLIVTVWVCKIYMEQKKEVGKEKGTGNEKRNIKRSKQAGHK